MTPSNPARLYLTAIKDAAVVLADRAPSCSGFSTHCVSAWTTVPSVQNQPRLAPQVHHKTEFGSNLTGHGFPDPGHLDNVLEELRAQGITEDDGLVEK